MRNTIVVAVLAIGVVLLAVAAWWYRPQDNPEPKPQAASEPATPTVASTPASGRSATSEPKTAASQARTPTDDAAASASEGADERRAEPQAATAAAPTTPPTAAPSQPEATADAAPAAMKSEQTAAREPTGPTPLPSAATADTANTEAATPQSAEKPAAKIAITPPSFDVVRIDQDGTAVIAGRAEPGAQIILRLGDRVIARTDSNGRGEWVVVIGEPLPSGASTLELEARLGDTVVAADGEVAVIVPDRPQTRTAATDPEPKPDTTESKTTLSAAEMESRADAQGKPLSGNQPVDNPPTAVAVLVPKSASERPTLLQKPEPVGKKTGEGLSLDAVDYDEKGNVVLSGNAPAGSTVRTYIDNQPAGESTTDGKRNWEVKPPATLPAGTYTLRVDQLDSTGKVASRVELPFTRASAQKVLAASAARYRVVVQPGNSLWRIARRVYGRGMLYTVIYRANDEQIRDPDMIYPGQVFDLPETRQN